MNGFVNFGGMDNLPTEGFFWQEESGVSRSLVCFLLNIFGVTCGPGCLEVITSGSH